ncbi:glycine--tRNA ligase [Candidatus Chromulinivorax destructor]|uniref:glycine--tRNA ligase n=1 Tax=Candidatus Chromulinivorax destructor TaxID=2066483 RepID=A0A345ZCX8_9BACT|nr:glycine--tRNA ligase [Candidatus Chromulinivorax destructor]AXK61145.1 glycine--tRNA ligase [Candidatus Chromulinivorax destructor]
MQKPTQATLDKIISLCKRKGFVFQTAEIYGGLNGVYDFGHLGFLLRENIKRAWRNSIENDLGEIYTLEGSLLGTQRMWEASGHIDNFHDPMVDCKNCKKRFRTDDGSIDLNKNCPDCGIKNWTEVRNFNLMFKTELGAVADGTAHAYLRPETAQTIFINFKNMMTTNRAKMPFGVAQIGKSFRNEITPKQFLFRLREFEQMELEWFCSQESAMENFEFWLAKRREFYRSLGLNMDRIRFHAHGKEELAHYSVCCTDIEYEFPFGFKELEGIAHRGTFDLTQHSKFSGKDLAVFDEATKTSHTPVVVETSVGVDRLFLTLLFDAYYEDEMDGETRVVLKFAPHIAPIKLAIFPLTKKLEEPALALFKTIKKTVPNIQFDVTGSIGKRYRRQDEIGTPFCITYDFDTEHDNCVTIRDRDSGKQDRIAITDIMSYLTEHGVINS